MFENDANLGAMGEFIWGRGETQNLAYIKLDSGIGSGHLVNGELMTGSEGLAGEIGHMFADPNAGTCYCGGYGCLVQVLGLDALQKHLTALGIDDAHGTIYRSCQRRRESGNKGSVPQSVKHSRCAQPRFDRIISITTHRELSWWTRRSSSILGGTNQPRYVGIIRCDSTKSR